MSLFIHERCYAEIPKRPTSFDQVAFATMDASAIRSQLRKSERSFLFLRSCVDELKSIRDDEFSASIMLKIGEEDASIRKNCKDYRIQRVVKERGKPFSEEGTRLMGQCQQRREALAKRVSAVYGAEFQDLNLTDLVIKKMECLEKCNVLKDTLNEKIYKIKSTLKFFQKAPVLVSQYHIALSFVTRL
ncbi:MAG: hypothetical protein K2P51_06055 [Rhabdochlamydiaceae bacterium]|nr:hypothetical protein [Rhabdochlamydiaceae bacterium]